MNDFCWFEKTQYSRNQKLAQTLSAKADSLSSIIVLSGNSLKSVDGLAVSQNRLFFFDTTKKSKRYGGSFLVRVGNVYSLVSSQKLKLSSDVVGKLVHSELASTDLFDSTASAA